MTWIDAAFGFLLGAALTFTTTAYWRWRAPHRERKNVKKLETYFTDPKNLEFMIAQLDHVKATFEARLENLQESPDELHDLTR